MVAVPFGDTRIRSKCDNSTINRLDADNVLVTAMPRFLLAIHEKKDALEKKGGPHLKPPHLFFFCKVVVTILTGGMIEALACDLRYISCRVRRFPGRSSFCALLNTASASSMGLTVSLVVLKSKIMLFTSTDLDEGSSMIRVWPW